MMIAIVMVRLLITNHSDSDSNNTTKITNSNHSNNDSKNGDNGTITSENQ